MSTPNENTAYVGDENVLTLNYNGDTHPPVAGSDKRSVLTTKQQRLCLDNECHGEQKVERGLKMTEED